MSRPSRWAAGWAVLAGACGAGGDPAGFDGPWAAIHDPAADVYYVSNVAGAPLAADGNGYVARVRPDGSMDRRWLGGGRLHAPKGLALHAGVLFVVDLAAVHRFDAASGRHLGAWDVAGASFLDDVAVAADGTVYVTDRGCDAELAPIEGRGGVRRLLPDGRSDVLADAAAIGHPAAIAARPGGLYVVDWRDGGFRQLDYRGVRTDLAAVPQGRLCGLVRVEHGGEAGWIAASWQEGCAYRFDAKGGIARLGGGWDRPGDLGIDAGRGLLLVPCHGADRLELVPLSGAATDAARPR